MRRAILWSIGLMSLWLSSSAQDTAPPLLELNGMAKSTPEVSQVVGTAASDLIPGNGTRGQYSLRYAPVVPNSEVVLVDGKRLARDLDYWIDYGSGTLSFAVPVRRFSTVQVSYRYDPQGKREEAVSALPLLSLSFGQSGGLQALYMPGMTETTREGVSYRLSAYGMQNALRFGGENSLQGYFFIGSQEQVRAYASPTQANPSRSRTVPAEVDQFIMQSLQMNTGALQVQANYQDIGRNFSHQKMLGVQSGFDSKQLAQLERERGLKRFDYTLGLQFDGNTSLQQSHLRIEDDKGAITQEGWQFSSRSLNLNWTRRESSAEFQRYKDLADVGKDEWFRERGLVSEQMTSSLQLASNSTAKYERLSISQGDETIERVLYGVDLPWLKVNRVQQSVGEKFTRFGDLTEADKGQLAREVGMSRDITQIQLQQPGFQASTNLQRITSPSGELERQHIQVQTENLQIEHLHRSVSAEFGQLPNLKPEEHQQMAEEVRAFHDPTNAVPLKPEDVPQVFREAGLERTLQRAEIKPAKDLTLQFKRYSVGDTINNGDITGTQWQLRTPNFQVRLHDRDIGSNFGRLRDLTRIEQMMFHNEQGIQRSDWDMMYTTKGFGFAVANTRIMAIGAGVQRTSYRLITPLLEFNYNQRQVDSDFSRAHDLADPERDFLAQLRGFRQHDWTAKLRVAPNLQLELFQFDANNPLEQIGNKRNRYRFLWQPTKQLTFGRQADQYRSDKLSEGLYHDEYERNDIQYILGFGQINAYQERRQIGGTLANPLYQNTEYWRFGSDAIRNMNLSLEERRTVATGAVSERFRNYQVGYQVNPQMKVNLAHAEANREGVPDESSQQIGFEYKIREGTTLSFSETRQGREGANGTRVMSAGLTQTAFGVLSIGGAYQEWRHDHTNTRAQSQVVVQSAKPFDFIVFKGLQFDFRYGALADRGMWQQENKHFTAQATMFSHKVSGGYVGLYVPGQGRAVDRYYQIEAPPNEVLQYNLMYKTRTYQDGRLFLVRQYNITYKPNKFVAISHEFQSHPEQANQNVVLGSVLQPTGFSMWKMEWRWTERVLLKGDYRIEWNDQQNRRVRLGGLGLSANQSDNLRYDLGYRVSAERFGTSENRAHTFYLSTERKIDSENYLMFGFQWTHYERRADPNIPRDQQRLVLELRRPF